MYIIQKKAAKVLFLSFLIPCLFSSCCHKRYCGDEIRYQNKIKIFNYLPEEIDSVVVYSYVKNSGFNTPIDSTYESLSYRDGTHQFYSNILYDFDYKIQVLNTGDIYTVNNFFTYRKVCNKCFLGDDYYKKLVGYSVNSMVKSGEIIEIEK